MASSLNEHTNAANIHFMCLSKLQLPLFWPNLPLLQNFWTTWTIVNGSNADYRKVMQQVVIFSDEKKAYCFPVSRRFSDGTTQYVRIHKNCQTLSCSTVTGTLNVDYCINQGKRDISRCLLLRSDKGREYVARGVCYSCFYCIRVFQHAEVNKRLWVLGHGENGLIYYGSSAA